jgi:hypothetical protein
VDPKVELEPHLVAEFDLDVAVAADEKAWTIVDHETTIASFPLRLVIYDISGTATTRA